LINLPDKVKVACFDIKVEEWHPNSANSRRCYGEFSALELLIRIDVSSAPTKIVDTLIHELNHAIYWVYGMEDGDEEERIVGTMATAWTQVYRDNPDILDFIKTALLRK